MQHSLTCYGINSPELFKNCGSDCFFETVKPTLQKFANDRNLKFTFTRILEDNILIIKIFFGTHELEISPIILPNCETEENEYLVQVVYQDKKLFFLLTNVHEPKWYTFQLKDPQEQTFTNILLNEDRLTTQLGYILAGNDINTVPLPECITP